MPGPCTLARFLLLEGMNSVLIVRRRMPVENRIDELSRLALVILLLATLGGVLL